MSTQNQASMHSSVNAKLLEVAVAANSGDLTGRRNRIARSISFYDFKQNVGRLDGQSGSDNKAKIAEYISNKYPHAFALSKGLETASHTSQPGLESLEEAIQLIKEFKGGEVEKISIDIRLLSWAFNTMTLQGRLPEALKLIDAAFTLPRDSIRLTDLTANPHVLETHQHLLSSRAYLQLVGRHRAGAIIELKGALENVESAISRLSSDFVRSSTAALLLYRPMLKMWEHQKIDNSSWFQKTSLLNELEVLSQIKNPLTDTMKGHIINMTLENEINTGIKDVKKNISLQFSESKLSKEEPRFRHYGDVIKSIFQDVVNSAKHIPNSEAVAAAAPIQCVAEQLRDFLIQDINKPKRTPSTSLARELAQKWISDRDMVCQDDPFQIVVEDLWYAKLQPVAGSWTLGRDHPKRFEFQKIFNFSSIDFMEVFGHKVNSIAAAYSAYPTTNETPGLDPGRQEFLVNKLHSQTPHLNFHRAHYPGLAAVMEEIMVQLYDANRLHDAYGKLIKRMSDATNTLAYLIKRDGFIDVSPNRIDVHAYRYEVMQRLSREMLMGQLVLKMILDGCTSARRLERIGLLSIQEGAALFERIHQDMSNHGESLNSLLHNYNKLVTKWTNISHKNGSGDVSATVRHLNEDGGLLYQEKLEDEASSDPLTSAAEVFPKLRSITQTAFGNNVFYGVLMAADNVQKMKDLIASPAYQKAIEKIMVKSVDHNNQTAQSNQAEYDDLDVL